MSSQVPSAASEYHKHHNAYLPPVSLPRPMITCLRVYYNFDPAGTSLHE